MNSVLLLASEHLDDRSLKSLSLSCSSLLVDITQAMSDQHFHYCRCKHLTGTDLSQRAEVDWKTVHAGLTDMLHMFGEYTCSNTSMKYTPLLQVVLELGLDPSQSYGILMAAVGVGNVDSVRLLLQDGRVTSSDIANAKRLAQHIGQADVVALLSSY